MEIRYAFFAETAQITSDGRVNILGADLHMLNVQGPAPWTSPMMALLVSIHLEREDCGRLYHFTADLIAPNGRNIDPHVENDFIAPVPENLELSARFNVVLQMFGVALPELGLYHMRVVVEDREGGTSQEKRVRLRVLEAAQQALPA